MSFAETLKTDRHHTVQKLSELHDTSFGRAHSILNKEMKMIKFSNDILLQLYYINISYSLKEYTNQLLKR